MQAAALLTALAGVVAAAWGHGASSAPAFYGGVLLLCTALGPLAFAAGRERWPPVVLKLCIATAAAGVGLLATELGIRLADALRSAGAESDPRPVFRYADARADPAAFRRWWRDNVRAFWSRGYLEADPTGRQPFRLRRSSDSLLYGSRVHINALGFRGSEIRRDKGAAFRIVALGESTTFGRTLSAGDRPWPDVLETLIRRELSCGALVQVVNGGVPGWNLVNQLQRLEAEILPLAPDLVISYHGYNGFEYLFPELAPVLVEDPPGRVTRPSRVLSALESHWVHRRFLRRYEEARALARSVPEIDLGRSEYARVYRRLARRLAAAGIPVAIATFNMAVDGESPEDVLRFYEETFPDIRARLLANRLHTRLVLELPLGENVIPADTSAGLNGAYEEHFIDAVHLTQSGRDLLARNLLTALREWLRSRPRMRCGAPGPSPPARPGPRAGGASAPGTLP